MYYDTVPETVDNVLIYSDKAKSQRDRILSFMRHNMGKLYTPADVWNELYQHTNVPITSVRRTMTDLSKEGVLIKCRVKREGIYGRSNSCWSYPGTPLQMTLFE